MKPEKSSKTSREIQENSRRISTIILEKTLNILEKSYEYIEQGYYSYICNAVRSAGQVDGISYEIALRIEKYINLVLIGKTYGTWLLINHTAFYILYKSNETEGRLQWIKYMIEQVKSGEFIFLKEYNK